jgi:hypothetical protein
MSVTTLAQHPPNVSLQVFNTCTGPGYYDLDRVLATGEVPVLSNTHSLKKKPVGSFEPHRRAMSKSKFGITKSTLNL